MELGLLSHNSPLMTLLMDLLDHSMALETGLGHILDVDRRTGRGVGQNLVRSVAVIASGRNQKPFLEHAFAVDAFPIVLHHVLLEHAVFFGDRLTFPVALPA